MDQAEVARGPVVVFERPRFSKWGSRVSMSILVAALLWSFFSNGGRESRMLLGSFAVLCAIPLVIVWFGVGQSIALSAEGITIGGRLGTTFCSWADFAQNRGPALPSYNWNDTEIDAPAEIANAEPLFELLPPESGAPTPLQAAAYRRFRPTGEWWFRLLDALLEIRRSDPSESWTRQVATVFRARDALGLGPARGRKLPRAIAARR